MQTICISSSAAMPAPAGRICGRPPGHPRSSARRREFVRLRSALTLPVADFHNSSPDVTAKPFLRPLVKEYSCSRRLPHPVGALPTARHQPGGWLQTASVVNLTLRSLLIGVDRWKRSTREMGGRRGVCRPIVATPLCLARPSPSGWAEDSRLQGVDHDRHTEKGRLAAAFPEVRLGTYPYAVTPSNRDFPLRRNAA